MGANEGGTDPSYRRTKVSEKRITTGNWHHVVCIIRGATDIDIYIDCEDAGGSYGGFGAPRVEYSSVPGRIGTEPATIGSPTTYYNGTMDDFAFWNRALKAEEIVEVCESSIMITEITDTTTVEIVDSTAVEIPLENNLVRILANDPSGDIFTIQISDDLLDKGYVFYMYDLLGRPIWRIQLNENNRTLDRRFLPIAIYLYVIRDAEGKRVKEGKILAE